MRKVITKLLGDKSNRPRRRKVLLSLAVLVVFVTTYSLILPAITLDDSAADEMPGIETEQTEQAEQTDQGEQAKQDKQIKQDEQAEQGEQAKQGEQTKPAGTDREDKKQEQTKEDSGSDQETLTGETKLTAEGKDYTVVAVCGKDTKLPADVKLQVKEIKQGTNKYDEYSEKALDAVRSKDGNEGKKLARRVRLFDISFVSASAGSEEALEPDADVSVKIVFDKGVKINDTTKIRAVHFGERDESGEYKSEVLSTKAKITEKDVLQEASFESDEFSVYGVVYTVDFHYEFDGEKYDYSIQGESSVKLSKLVDELGVLKGTDFADAQAFLEEVEDVTFSDDSLLKVSRVSGENDWMLESLVPFGTEETLTVKMKNGDAFKVKVTDAKISKEVLTASGETYKITVTYDETAQIPDGAELEVEELKEGSDEYTKYLKKATKKMGITGDELSYARFFDIEIVDPYGNKIEPAAAVQVKIAYTDAPKIKSSEKLKVVHFADKGTELISDVDVSDDSRKITYSQSSFSITGTIVSGQPANGDERMVLIKDGTRYYIVNSDASLTEVGYDESKGEVYVADPMLWRFEVSGNNRHIYFNSEATGFHTTKLTSDYYRRYLDPASDKAWLQEQSEDNSKDSYVTVTKDQDWQDEFGKWYVENHIEDPSGRLNPLNATNLTFTGDTISHDGKYFAIERDEDGKPVRLVGGKSADDPDVAHFLYATASKVPSGLHLDNAVDHIDIAIESDTVTVDVPLAYGQYYDANGNVIKTVTENTNLTLTQDQVPSDLKYMLDITTDDMKRATITARNQNGTDIDDAFYVTGYSANTSTNISSPQVRIEGRFLCADLRGTEYENVDWFRYDGYWGYGIDQNYVNAVRLARLANKVEYTITVTKPVTFNLVDPEAGQLYDEDGEPLTITVDCAFSGSFNYWDKGKTAKNSGNECPPLQGNGDWERGDIPSHDMSGMDFVLSGNAEDIDSPLVALEIVKVIRDENGNNIKVSAPVTNTFDIYQNKTANRNGVAGLNVDSYEGEREGIYDNYTKLRSRNIKVGEQGSAIIFDYNVTDGMYYITEDKSSVPDTLTDKDGNEYEYEKTYFETEYVRRGDQYDDKTQYPDPMHVSAEYTKNSSEYKSIPEVLGRFTDLNNNVKKESYLEFYVYNIYKQVYGEISIKKTDEDGGGLSGAVFQLKTVGSDGHSESLAENIEGLGTVTKEINGETTTFNSAFETNGGNQTLGKLPDGTYRLYEVFVPAGYVNTLQYIEFKVENHVVTLITQDSCLNFEAASGDDDTACLTIKNTAGKALPSTGGPGTIWMYVLGAAMILGSLGIAAMRRRRFCR